MNETKLLPKHIVGIALALYIGGLVFLNLITPNRDFSEVENRRLEQSPRFSFDQLLAGDFTADYERYIADQFVFKDFWVGVKSGFESAIGKKEYNGVYLGADNYLLPTFQQPDQQSFTSKLEAINTFSLATPRQNKYFMLVPNSGEILSDKLPRYAQIDDQQIWLERVQETLDKNIKFVDVYGALASRKNEYLFYRTDHHWTTTGAFYGYQHLIKELGYTPHEQKDYQIKQVADDFYGTMYSQSGLKQVSSDSINLYVPKYKQQLKVIFYDESGIGKETNTLLALENIKQKDKYKLFLDGNHPLIKICTNKPNGKQLLIIKDSYANCLIPFLTDHYHEIYVVDLRYYYDNPLELIKNNRIKDVLFLYNVNTFFTDPSVESIADYIDLNNLDRTDASEEINYKEYFKEDLFMGDSITEAITYLGLLEQQNVCGQVGVNINESLSQISSIKISNPNNIYLLYGVNDMDDRADSQWFVEQYRGLVCSLKAKFPNANIYVQSVLPVAGIVEQRQPHTNNNYIKKCNAQLLKMTEQENVQYLDIASLLDDNSQQLYEADGFHFKAPFYKLWFDYIIWDDKSI